MMDLEELKRLVLDGKPIEDVLEKFDWREVERIISEIFKENGFQVRQNFRFKTERRYEIDILAVREDLVFCVDCKEWSRGRYKKSGLRQAVKLQENRLKEFKEFVKKNFIAQSKLNMDIKSDFYPMLVTLFEEDMIKENDTFVVPVWKLNNFLNDSYVHYTESDG